MPPSIPDTMMKHWQARTMETEKATAELRLCLNVVNQIIVLWETSTDEDRQQMANMLFA
jgi:hypothetical protein